MVWSRRREVFSCQRSTTLTCRQTCSRCPRSWLLHLLDVDSVLRQRRPAGREPAARCPSGLRLPDPGRAARPVRQQLSGSGVRGSEVQHDVEHRSGWRTGTEVCRCARDDCSVVGRQFAGVADRSDAAAPRVPGFSVTVHVQPAGQGLYAYNVTTDGTAWVAALLATREIVKQANGSTPPTATTAASVSPGYGINWEPAVGAAITGAALYGAAMWLGGTGGGRMMLR